MATEVASAYVSITAKTAGLTSGLAAADAQVRGFASRADSSANGSGQAFGLMGKAMAAGAAIGVVGLGYAVKKAADFEQQLSTVQSVTGATSGELDTMRKAALKWGSQTKFSATESAAAMVELGKGGLSASQIVGGALPASLSLAAAGNLELKDAAEFTVKAMDQFGLSGKATTKIADSFAAAANMTTGDVKDFGMALTQGGAAAKSAGWSFDETMLALTALGKASVFGSDAGTSLKTALLQMIAPTKKQAEAAREVGLSFTDANGNMKDAATISRDLRTATEGMTRAQRTALFTTLAGTDGVRTLLALYDAGPAQLGKYDQALQKSGTAARVAAIQQDNLKGKMEQLNGALETIAIQVGSALIPILSDAAVGAANFLQAVSESQGLREFGSTVLSAFTTAANAVRAIASPVAQFVSLLGRIPGFASGSATALMTLAGVLLAMKAATVGAGIASSAAAFAQLAVGVRSASGAASLAGATFPKLTASVVGLTSPAGLAAAAVVGLGVAVYALSRMAGPGMAERFATSLRQVANAADAAKGAVARLDGAVGNLKDAELAHKGALIEQRAAQESLNALRQSGTATSTELAQANHRLQMANRQVDKTNQDLSKSQNAANDTAYDAIVNMARLSTENSRASRSIAENKGAVERMSQAMGVNNGFAQRMANEQARLAAQGGQTAARMDALRAGITRLSGEIDTSTAAGQRMKSSLTAAASLSDAGLVRFAGSLQRLRERGVPQAQAIEQALKEAAQGRTATVNIDDNASKIAHYINGMVQRISDRTVTISAIDQASGVARSVASAIASIPITKITTLVTRPRHESGSPTVYQTIDMINDLASRTIKRVSFKPSGTGATESYTGSAEASMAAYANPHGASMPSIDGDYVSALRENTAALIKSRETGTSMHHLALPSSDRLENLGIGV